MPEYCSNGWKGLFHISKSLKSLNVFKYTFFSLDFPVQIIFLAILNNFCIAKWLAKGK